MRGVLDPPVSAFSLSLYRHPFIYTLFNSRFTLIINNNIHKNKYISPVPPLWAGHGPPSFTMEAIPAHVSRLTSHIKAEGSASPWKHHQTLIILHNILLSIAHFAWGGRFPDYLPAIYCLSTRYLRVHTLHFLLLKHASLRRVIIYDDNLSYRSLSQAKRNIYIFLFLHDAFWEPRITDGNIYIEYHMDFLPKTANFQGGDTRKTPKNTQFSKSRHRSTMQSKGPPNAIPSIPLNHGISRQTL
jgi:hypothetical protein